MRKITKIKVQYRKVHNPNIAVASYHPRGYGGRGKPEIITDVVIKLDPVLKKIKNRKLKKVILKHETDEIKARARGLPLSKAHQVAVNKEPKWFIKKYNTHQKLLKGLRD